MAIRVTTYARRGDMPAVLAATHDRLALAHVRFALTHDREAETFEGTGFTWVSTIETLVRFAVTFGRSDEVMASSVLT